VLVRHSQKAKDMMKDYYVGTFKDVKQKFSWEFIRSNKEKLYLVINNYLYDCTEVLMKIISLIIQEVRKY
jgi:cytochrome b involved in lipid metabolism